MSIYEVGFTGISRHECLVDPLVSRISGDGFSLALEILKSTINFCVTVERMKISWLKVGVREIESLGYSYV